MTQRQPWDLWPTTPVPALATLAALFTFAFLTAVFARGIDSDIEVHVVFVAQSMVSGDWLPNFLFFRLVAWLSTNSSDIRVLSLVTITLLSAAVAAKYVISVHIARTWLQEDFDQRLDDFERPRAVALLSFACFLLLFAFSLPVGGWRDYYYIGQFPPNVWHNSTTMFLMPFALALLWTAYRYLKRPSAALLVGIVMLAVLNVLIKPSFFVNFVVAFPLTALFVHRFSRATLGAIVAVAAPAIVMLAQARSLFVSKESASSLGSVEWSPFLVWGAYSDSFTMSLLVSLLFPAIVLMAYPRPAIHSRFNQLVAANFVVGIVVYTMLSETGPRQLDANFSWQVIVSTYMLFLGGLMTSMRAWMGRPRSSLLVHDWIVVGAFLAHVASGVVYLIRCQVLGVFL